jgi:hypothetical protein
MGWMAWVQFPVDARGFSPAQHPQWLSGPPSLLGGALSSAVKCSRQRAHYSPPANTKGKIVERYLHVFIFLQFYLLPFIFIDDFTDMQLLYSAENVVV